jgi:hypothetical protein
VRVDTGVRLGGPTLCIIIIIIIISRDCFLIRLIVPVSCVYLTTSMGMSADEVSIYYDPMIAKLIVWDVDRNAGAQLFRIRDYLDSFFCTKYSHKKSFATNASCSWVTMEILVCK